MPHLNIRDRANGRMPQIHSKINKISADLIKRCLSFEPQNRPSFTEIIEYIKSNDFDLIDKIYGYKISLLNYSNNNSICVFPSIYSKYFVNINKDFKLDREYFNKGSYAHVFEASRIIIQSQTEMQKMRFAVKIFFDQNKTKKDIGKFFREIQIQSLTNHIGIARFVGYSIPLMGKGNYSIITEFMPNGSLSSLLSQVNKGNAPYNWETIRAINIFGNAAAMAHIHKKKHHF